MLRPKYVRPTVLLSVRDYDCAVADLNERRAASCASRTVKGVPIFEETTSTARRLMAGTSSRRSPTVLPTSSGGYEVVPVTLPPGPHAQGPSRFRERLVEMTSAQQHPSEHDVAQREARVEREGGRTGRRVCSRLGQA